MSLTPHRSTTVTTTAAATTTVAGANSSPSLITEPRCPAAVREAYHALFTAVELALGARGGRFIAVAALDDTTRADLVAANLALLSAEGGDRTLLVDGNLRTPTLHDLFGVAAAPGMAQFLMQGHGDPGDPGALAQPTADPLLGVIAAGVGPARFDRLDRLGDVPAALQRLAHVADRVIVVVAPVLAGASIQRLGPHVDGVLLVLTAGRTRRVEAARATALLQKARVPVVGVVLTPSGRHTARIRG